MFQTSTWLEARNGRPGKTRVFAGGLCSDYYLTVANLVLRRKHKILTRSRSSGGGAGNVAVGHRSLAPNVPVVLLAAVGDDAEGRDLRRCMAGHRIEMPWPPLSGVSTSVSYAISERGPGTGTVLSDPGARAAPLPLDLVEQEMRRAEVFGLVAHRVNEQIAPLLQIAAKYHVPRHVGLGRAQVEELGYHGLEQALVEEVELLICNRAEARDLTGREDVAGQLEALRFGGLVRTVIITEGAAGIHSLHEGVRCDVPAYTDPLRPIVDDIGAGDAAHAAIGDRLLRGYPLELALLAGARQGFEACTALGATGRLLDAVAMGEYLSLAVGAGVV